MIEQEFNKFTTLNERKTELESLLTELNQELENSRQKLISLLTGESPPPPPNGVKFSQQLVIEELREIGPISAEDFKKHLKQRYPGIKLFAIGPVLKNVTAGNSSLLKLKANYK